jgi:hypothetical protein
VSAIAVALLDHLNKPTAQLQIHAANQPGGSSALVQAVFAQQAAELGFASEKKGLFVSYGAALRPDYYLPLPEFETGIILEVERGKTTTNNMDLLDMWKCHVSATSSNPMTTTSTSGPAGSSATDRPARDNTTLRSQTRAQAVGRASEPALLKVSRERRRRWRRARRGPRRRCLR